MDAPPAIRPMDPGLARRPASAAPVLPAAPPLTPLAPPLLVCDRVTKWYGPVIGVNQVTLELRPGITGLVGSNGAGKSTLLRLLTGHLRPDLGRVTIAGRDVWTASAKRLVGYCPDIDSFYEEMSGRQFVTVMARLTGYVAAEARRRTEATLELVGMADRADRKIRGYSKGMRQRIKLAQALLHDPLLLVLDEPLSGIDPVGRWESLELFRHLAERGKTLLISSHELDELEKLTDRVAIMARGRIAAVGTVTEIRDRLEEQPLTLRIDLESSAPPLVDRPPSERSRELAVALLRLPDVVAVELAEIDESNGPIQRVLVRVRNPQRFFRDFARLVLEEWYEVRHLEALDDSTQSVLGYLLGAT